MARPGSDQIELDGVDESRPDFEGIARSAGGGGHGSAGTLHGVSTTLTQGYRTGALGAAAAIVVAKHRCVAR